MIDGDSYVDNEISLSSNLFDFQYNWILEMLFLKLFLWAST